ncbi:MAG: hypothetical protein ACRDHG_01200 [Anaerolineales bacterium]
MLAGSAEPVFRVLPQRILEDLRHPRSESSLLWNLVYPRAQPTLSLRSLLELSPLWGTQLGLGDEGLRPYYWGYDVSGERLDGLDSVLEAVDGSGQQTEVDLFLLGERQLVLVEAKRSGGLGRCGRYLSGRCPEIHLPDQAGCRYWEIPAATFSNSLAFGSRPTPESDSPSCNRHYQLARTLKVGSALAAELNRKLHLWLWAPRARWPALETDWLDFADRVTEAAIWRHLRVLDWEAIRTLPT